jgi:hypothetical protein
MQIYTHLFDIHIAGPQKIRAAERRMAGPEKDTEMPSLGRFRL